jgi:hypothetical protein
MFWKCDADGNELWGTVVARQVHDLSNEPSLKRSAAFWACPAHAPIVRFTSIQNVSKLLSTWLSVCITPEPFYAGEASTPGLP